MRGWVSVRWARRVYSIRYRWYTVSTAFSRPVTNGGVLLCYKRTSTTLSMCNFCLFFFSLLPTIIEVLLSWQIRNGDGQWVIINVFSPLSQMCRSILTDYCVLCSLREYYGFVSWPACGSAFGCTKRISDCQLSKCSPTVRPQLQRTVGIAMRANNSTTRKKNIIHSRERDESRWVESSRYESSRAVKHPGAKQATNLFIWITCGDSSDANEATPLLHYCICIVHDKHLQLSVSTFCCYNNIKNDDECYV